MKKYILGIMACLAMIFTLNSCFSDDDDYVLTEEDKSLVIYDISGIYSGDFVTYYVELYDGYPSGTEQRDTMANTVTLMGDKSYQVEHFPLAKLASILPAYENQDLIEAMETAQTAKVTGQFEPVQINPATVYFSYMSFSLTYADGATHIITVMLDSSLSLAKSTGTTLGKTVLVQLVPIAIYVDDALTYQVSELNLYYTFTGTSY